MRTPVAVIVPSALSMTVEREKWFQACHKAEMSPSLWANLSMRLEHRLAVPARTNAAEIIAKRPRSRLWQEVSKALVFYEDNRIAESVKYAL